MQERTWPAHCRRAVPVGDVDPRRRGWRAGRPRRRGLAAVWVLLGVPTFLVMLIFASEIGNLWLARAELETALEASALAAAGRWCEMGDTAAGRASARDYGVAYAAANTVGGQSLLLDRNESIGSPNDNASCTGDLVLGQISGTGCEYTFDALASPGVVGGGVRAQRQWQVTPLFSSWIECVCGPWTVSAEATAACEAPHGTPRLVRIVDFQCN